MQGESRATNTLFAGVQMILPGEVAPAHRHVSSAIRFVLDGEGAYTAVEGEKSYMSPGDFVITANWAPHDHGNTSNKPMLWLDVLDFPQVNFFEASFAEHFEEATQSTSRGGRRLARLLRLRRAAGRRPGAHEPQPGHQLHLRPHAADHRAHDEGGRHRQASRRARALRQSRSMAARCCPPWAPVSRCCRRASRARSTARPTASIFVCVEGKGTTTVDGKVLEWGPNDVFVVPPWKHYLPQRREGIGAVLDLRPALAGSARDLARGHPHALGQVRANCARLGHRAELTDPGHPGIGFFAGRRHGTLRRDLRLAAAGAAQMLDDQQRRSRPRSRPH